MTAFNEKKNCSAYVSVLVIIFSFLLSTIFPDRINTFVKEGVYLCGNVIIASVFPFLILTDVIVAFARFENIKPLRKLCTRLFNVNEYAITALMCGLLCGFPIGVKVSADLYKSGCISKDECERLIGFSNNTGPAFLISGIGFGMRGCVVDGVVLYVSMLISSIFAGIIVSIGRKPSSARGIAPSIEYSFSKSVSSSALNTINICAYIVLFSVITGIITTLTGSGPLKCLILPFLEVSNAARTIATSMANTKSLGLILTSFAVSFSGLSVHLQAKSFLKDTDVSMRTYYSTKLLQGLISAAITAIIILIK